MSVVDVDDAVVDDGNADDEEEEEDVSCDVPTAEWWACRSVSS